MDQISKSSKATYLKSVISWQDQVVTVLPLVLFSVTLIQILATYKYFDLNIYDNQSVEILTGSINSIWEKLFVINSVLVSALNFFGLIGYIFKQKWSFTLILLSAILSLGASVIVLNIISIATGMIWIGLLLHIRKEFLSME